MVGFLLLTILCLDCGQGQINAMCEFIKRKIAYAFKNKATGQTVKARSLRLH